MTTTYQLEPITSLWDEILPLVKAHYHEVAHYQDIELAPDFDQYDALDQAGILRAYTARVDGVLIGYAIFMVKRNLHYSRSLQAIQDVLFILPEYRKNGVGAGLILHCDMELDKLGAEVVYHHVKVKPELDFSPLLERIGYELIDKIYGKRM